MTQTYESDAIEVPTPDVADRTSLLTNTPPTPAPVPVVPVTQLAAWGPFADYTLVTTEHGNFGVPAGQILTFVLEKTWMNKNNRFEIMPMPNYELVWIDDLRSRPVILEDGIDLEAQRTQTALRQERQAAQTEADAAATQRGEAVLS